MVKGYPFLAYLSKNLIQFNLTTSIKNKILHKLFYPFFAVSGGVDCDKGNVADTKAPNITEAYTSVMYWKSWIVRQMTFYNETELPDCNKIVVTPEEIKKIEEEEAKENTEVKDIWTSLVTPIEGMKNHFQINIPFG